MLCFVTDIEVGRSIENLTEDEDDGAGDGEWPETLRRGGDDERVKKGDDREAKLEEDEANVRDVVLAPEWEGTEESMVIDAEVERKRKSIK